MNSKILNQIYTKIIMNKNRLKYNFLTLILIGSMVNKKVVAQGILVPKIDSANIKIDPARYHKLQIIDFKIGNHYSDDRSFQRFLKDYGYEPGKNTFFDFGVSYNYLVKKLNLGIKGDLSTQNTTSSIALKHLGWQATIGYALKRKESYLITLNSNFGVQTSTIRFGGNPPDFLAKLDYDHSSSRLFQKQFVVGPTININKLYNKRFEDGGLSLGLELGANYAPFKPKWSYGFEDENNEFIGQRVNNLPQVGKTSYFTTLKLGFWAAK
jgi:hypothetical protein